MLKFFKSLYLNSLVYYVLSSIIILFLVGFIYPVVERIASGLLILFVILLVIDTLVLFTSKKNVQTQRILPEKLSNGDENPVKIYIFNHYKFRINVKIIDEVPFQFQLRNFEFEEQINSNEESAVYYTLVPKKRGEYFFGTMNIFVSSPLRFVARRFKHHQGKMIKTYPSFIHLPEYEIMALKNEFLYGGVKKIRKLGQALEFEQIKEYVPGDDIRTINWKATSRKNQLMVNQYQEERSQRIYMLIDKGRTMEMPFDNFSLLDYAINASMALSHIVLKKKDHPGVMSFSRKTEDALAANAKGNQIRRIADTLYNIETNFVESDYGSLYADLKRNVTRRSLMLLFSNFETLDALNRQLKYLRAIAKNHVLIVVFFKNTELQNMIKSADKSNIQEVYDQIIAEKFEYEKKLIRNELSKYGIQSVYTLPQNLSVNVINKYIEVKSRGII